MAANLPSPGRSSGDGMESVKSSSSPPPSETLPLAGNAPSSLSKAWKKPKFVPYEPYKGAVRPIVREMAHHPRKITPAPDFVPIRVPPPEYGRKKTSSGSSGGTAVSSGSRQQSLMVDKMECLDLAAGDGDASSGEVEDLRRELKIQQQINSELKNLLVASIGEDWEPRVESLSTDKAILGEYVKHYSDSLTRQTEEKDNISIECDVWRSKFLASSLMVDELARCKAILACRCQEAREALQALSDEHSRLATEVRDVNRNLKSCQAYIDGVHERVHSSGSGSGSGPKVSSKAEEDVLRLVSEANMRSSLILRSLRDRQQYNEARGRPCSPDAGTFAGKDECRVPMTPAQTMANKVLADLRDMPYVVNENLKSASALYFPINKALPFKCCSHCQGDIKVV